VIDFFKYQAAGNDYLVIDPRYTDFPVTPEAIRLVCDRHRGIGADGVLYGPLETPRAGVPVALDLYNSDGSDCGRSGNGLRMFALHLAEQERFGYIRERLEEFRQLWYDVLKAGMSDGIFRRDLDVELAYRFLRDTVWVGVSWYRPEGSLGIDSIAAQYLSIVVDGISPRPGSTK